jgi:type II secretory pathway component PulM
MEEEIKKLLQENLEVSKESLKILRGIQRRYTISFIGKLIYWAIIIFLLIYFYNFLKPYFDKILNLLESLEKIKGVNAENSQNIQQIIELMKKIGM